MTTAKPLARYGAIECALARGFATAELHHATGRDPIKTHTEAKALECFRAHGLSKRAVDILLKENKNKKDFDAFIEERERFFVELLSAYSFKQPVKAAETEGDDISED